MPGILPRWKAPRARPVLDRRVLGVRERERDLRDDLDARSEARIVVGREPQEQGVQRGSVAGVERCQELSLDALDDLAEGCELVATRGSQADDVAAAVAGIATTLDQSMLLERVEQPDQLAPVELKGVGDRRLRVARRPRRAARGRSGGTG